MNRAAHTETERTAMAASLKAAEARIEAGQYVEHDPKTFVDRLMNVRASARVNTIKHIIVKL